MAEDDAEPPREAAEEPLRREPPGEPPREGPGASPRPEPGLTERIRARLKKLMDDDPNIYPLF